MEEAIWHTSLATGWTSITGSTLGPGEPLGAWRWSFQRRHCHYRSDHKRWVVPALHRVLLMPVTYPTDTPPRPPWLHWLKSLNSGFTKPLASKSHQDGRGLWVLYGRFHQVFSVRAGWLALSPTYCARDIPSSWQGAFKQLHQRRLILSAQSLAG